VRETFNNLLNEYGPVAVVIHFTLFGVVLFGAWMAINFGWQPESATGSLGTVAAAYVATRATMPFRLGATAVLTPLVARVYTRFTGKAVEAAKPEGAAAAVVVPPADAR
jgi:hypothetical protein